MSNAIVVSIDLKEAHKLSAGNRESVEKSSLCGCYECIRIFTPSLIKDWMDEGQTAKCPFCELDTVIDNASGLPITQKFLERLHRYSNVEHIYEHL